MFNFKKTKPVSQKQPGTPETTERDENKVGRKTTQNLLNTSFIQNTIVDIPDSTEDEKTLAMGFLHILLDTGEILKKYIFFFKIEIQNLQRSLLCRCCDLGDIC